MAVQTKLPGLQPGRQTTRVYQSEKIVQARIEQALRSRGYRVWSTVHQYKLQCCPVCHHKFRPTGGYGSSRGIADLLIRGPHFPPGVVIMCEVKGEKTPLSPVQKIEAEAGDIFIVRSVEQALYIVACFERYLQRRH